MPAYITGMGACLPNKPVHNARIEAILGLVGGVPSALKDVILDRNGIKWRYYAVDPETGRATHTNAGLTAGAVRVLAQTAGLDLKSVDLLACGTSSPDQVIPSHASMVQGLLGCGPCEIASTAGVCCSSVAAMKYATASVAAGMSRSAVATGSELVSPALRASQFLAAPHEGDVRGDPYLGFDREFLRFMLSDGAGAMLIEPEPRAGRPALRIDWIDVRSYANELPACMYTGALKQEDGTLRGWRSEEGGPAEAVRRGYFNLAQDVHLLSENIVKLAGRFFAEVRRRHGVGPEDVDWLVPHISSMFFQGPLYEEMAAQGFDLPPERWFTNLMFKGNTGAASFPIMLEELYRSGKLGPGDRILCAVPESARFTFAAIHLTVEQRDTRH